ncbi:MAG: DUF721 domain-containing protein [Chromatiales bacterium]|nr:DUF721 domain-containing protein [Chromatiales bacterium]
MGQLIAQARACQHQLDEIRALLPAPMGDHCVACVPDGPRMTLFVSTPAWATRFRYLAPALTTRLGVSGVDVRLAPPSPTAPVTRRRPTPDLSPARAALQATAAHVSDPSLAAALQRLLRAIGDHAG